MQPNMTIRGLRVKMGPVSKWLEEKEDKALTSTFNLLEHEWEIILEKRDEGHFGIFLKLIGGPLPQMRLDVVSYAVITGHGQRMYPYRIIDQEFDKGGPSWGRREFVPKSDILDESKKILVDDSLDVEVYATVSTLSKMDESKKYMETHAQRVLAAIWKDGANADTVVHLAKDQTVSIQRAIFAACSPVIRAMFQYEMKEKQEGVIHLKHVEEAVFRRFEEFVFTGFLKANNDQETIDVLKLAHELQVDSLIELCMKQLTESMNSDKFVDRLILADTMAMTNETLLQGCIHFIKSDSKRAARLLQDKANDILQKLTPQLAHLLMLCMSPVLDNAAICQVHKRGADCVDAPSLDESDRPSKRARLGPTPTA